jgi:hypothetical protein
MPLIWSPGLTVTAHQLINHSSALVDSLTIGAHASRHAAGGADALFPWNHASRHAAGGADALFPWNHASRHAAGGADALFPVSRTNISDFFASPFWDNVLDRPIALDLVDTKVGVTVYVVREEDVNLLAGDRLRGKLSGSGYYYFGNSVADRLDLSPYKIRMHSAGITNEAYIYDGKTDGNYARPGADVSAGETREVAVWDLGSVAERWLLYKLWSNTNWDYNRIKISNDDSTYTTIAETTYGSTIMRWEARTFRYLKWEVANTYSSAHSADYFRLFELSILSPKGTLPAKPVYQASADETAHWLVLHDASSPISYVLSKEYV